MSTTQGTDVVEQFVEALARRDFEASASTFTEEGRLRSLLPSHLGGELGGDRLLPT